MKDLDFDELDEAVNSLMKGVSKTQPQKSEDTEKTLDLTPTLNDEAKPSFSTLEEATTTIANASVPSPPRSRRQGAASSPHSPLAARRAGRFMDVVHPSSDMKKPTPPLPVSRHGVTVKPRFTMPEAPLDTSEPLIQPDAAKDEAAASTPEPAHHMALESEWPDPLEMAHFEEDTGSKEKAPATTLEEEWTMPEPTSKQDTHEAPEIELAPLVSPFLPDTKVEKRPLGTTASGDAKEPDHAPVPGPEANQLSTANDPNAQLPALLEDVAPQLPDELQSDLMAIEADTSDGSPKTEDVPPTEDTAVKPAVAAPAPRPVSVSPELEETSAPTGPTSISQQYRQEPSTSDQASGAIYDTEAYHQPLTHPPKDKSGWMWVVWIMLILLAGAGGGAALYFLGVV